MTAWKDVTLLDKEVFTEYLNRYQPKVSELSFTNLFMWRKYYRFQYAIENGYLILLANPKKQKPFLLFPIGDYKKSTFHDVITEAFRYFEKQGWPLSFRRVTEEETELLRRFVKSEEDIVLDRDHSDYLYRSKDLIELHGKKYDGKRNHIKHLKRNGKCRYVEIDARNRMHCYRLLELWHGGKVNHNSRELEHEKEATIEVLDNFEHLDVRGGLLSYNGKYEAFSIGEAHYHGSAVIHIEKANPHLDGAYEYMNQAFCENAWSQYEFINREQDLGADGLRYAKLSYAPIRLLDKYIVHIKALKV